MECSKTVRGDACFLRTKAIAKDGGTSISGASVVCYDTLHGCTDACVFTCYAVDHCNGSQDDSVACAPDITTIVVITFASIIGVSTICCIACFCAPCCVCAAYIRRRRSNRRNAAEDSKTNGALI
ncbi:hypothetical protein L596_015050 [Steinernema carpocapsae]|uniref:Uncharacterized protein n=1 Tax=Steinernema carpocapsae TaxID=34508 RepID=A0A4U5NEN8_STECR|nr:hypothetical protein L596_015050 [Steinernema carpocapsae]